MKSGLIVGAGAACQFPRLDEAHESQIRADFIQRGLS
jgi:hypothetical protein